jgi:hypothetical protein
MEAVTLMRTFGFQRSKSPARGKRDMFLRNRYTCEHFFTLDGVKKEGFGFPPRQSTFFATGRSSSRRLRGDA